MRPNKTFKSPSIILLLFIVSITVNYFITGSSHTNIEASKDYFISFEGIGTTILDSGGIARYARYEKFTFDLVLELLWMGLEFLIIYVIVLGITYYASQTAGLYRFVRGKQKKLNQTETLYFFLKKINTNKFLLRNVVTYKTLWLILVKISLKIIVYFILFSPAYVIAYSFKTDIDTDSIVFMIILGIVSNGLLINYANRFYTYLEQESKKGYTLTARVKNLKISYDPATINIRSLLKIKKEFPGHVLNHIFMNARFQYIQTVKEQAAFLVSGLIIIEMALNIQGHICYELLKNILYGNYEAVIFISLILFAIVKMTYVAVDYWYRIESRKYGY